MKAGYEEILAPQVLGMGDYIYNKAYRKGDLRIWITRDVYKHGQIRWHMSISTQTRYPLWDEIRDAWYDLRPMPECKDVTVGMLLPPEYDYVNVHPNCFHLHEIVE